MITVVKLPRACNSCVKFIFERTKDARDLELSDIIISDINPSPIVKFTVVAFINGNVPAG